MKTMTEDWARRVWLKREAPPCPGEGCRLKAGHELDGQTWCWNHYRKAMAERNSGVDISFSPEDFWAKVGTGGADDCWIWRGYIDERGYGRHWRRVGTPFAHRIAYELTHGPIAAGLHLDHLCVTPSCSNPRHLEPVSPSENRRRQALRQTHCLRGHELTPENTYIWQGGRTCRACARVRRAARA